MTVKRIFFVFFAIVFFVSCSDDEGSDYHYELLPISEVVVPEEFEHGVTYDLTVKYMIPDNCYLETDVLYEYDEFARNVAVVSLVLSEDDCNPLEIEETLTFQLQALQTNSYEFKFWQGDDENGEPIYLIVEVPVKISDKSANEFKTTHTKM